MVWVEGTAQLRVPMWMTRTVDDAHAKPVPPSVTTRPRVDLFPGHERAVGMNRGNVIERLMDGVLLGMLANVVHDNLAQWTYKTKGPATDIQPPVFKKDAKPGSFQARANIHNFIEWTRSLGVPMSFETADVMDGGRAFHVSACLMDVARGAPYLCALPALVEFERDIDAADKEGGDDVFQDDAGSEHGSGDGDHTACASPDDDGERDRVAEANSIEVRSDNVMCFCDVFLNIISPRPHVANPAALSHMSNHAVLPR